MQTFFFLLPDNNIKELINGKYRSLKKQFNQTVSFEQFFLFDWAKRFEMPLDAIYHFTSKNGLIDWFCSLHNKSAIVNQLAPSLETN